MRVSVTDPTIRARRMVMKRFILVSFLVLSALSITGCPGEMVPGEGGRGGSSTTISTDTHTIVSTGGAGGSGGAGGGASVCFLSSDCPVSTVICETMTCDPTGHKTDPGLMTGCYLMPDFTGTPCEDNGHAGTCHVINGKGVCVTG